MAHIEPLLASGGLHLGYLALYFPSHKEQSGEVFRTWLQVNNRVTDHISSKLEDFALLVENLH